MREIRLSGLHKIVLYQSILEFPASLNMEYACYLAYESGIGSTPEAVGQHKARAAHYRMMGGERFEWAAREEEAHAYFCENFIKEAYVPAHWAFATLIASVDGVAITDYTEDSLRVLLDRLKRYGLSAMQIAQELTTTALSFQKEQRHYFSDTTQNNEISEMVHFQQLRRRAVALCDYLLEEDVKHLATVQQVDEALLDLNPPEQFDDGHPGNVVVLRRRAFTQLCAVLNDHGVPEPGKLTVYDFYTRLQYVQEKMKAGQGRGRIEA